MISIKNITKSFKTNFWADSFYALKDVHFEINEGSTIGFLGANGAGKTTLIKIMMGFIRQDSGEIYFHESLGKTREQIFANIGFLPERPYFYPYLTGKSFLDYMAKLQSIPTKQKIERIALLSEKLRIDHALDRKIRGYSKGMLQRLGLASAILHEPKLVILDEPLSGLDPIGRQEVKNILFLLKKQGKTVFFSSHIVPDVEEVCDHIIVLEKGSLFYKGTIEQLISKNMKPKFYIKVMNNKIPDSWKTYYNSRDEVLEVPQEKKDECLNQLLQHRCDIVQLYRRQPTLEQVIYNRSVD